MKKLTIQEQCNASAFTKRVQESQTMNFTNNTMVTTIRYSKNQSVNNILRINFGR